MKLRLWLIIIFSFYMISEGIAKSEETIEYAKQLVIDKKYSEAFSFLKQFAERGDAKAQGGLGVMYCYGLGTKQDPNKAIYWIEKSIQQGDVESQYNLGVMYQEGVCVTKNEQKAIYWYEKAANQGYIDAQYNVGMIYRYGKDSSVDLKKAKYYFGLACTKGDTSSCNMYLELEK